MKKHLVLAVVLLCLLNGGVAMAGGSDQSPDDDGDCKDGICTLQEQPDEFGERTK